MERPVVAPLEKARKGSGTARIYAEIRERILNLELAPGMGLDEGALERLLGVSRTPIREALIRLGSEGLVQHEPNRGATVAPISLDSVRQFFEALDLCQRAVTRWAALRRTDAQLEVIRTHHMAFEQAVLAGDPSAMTESNNHFHLAIAASCGNTYLETSYARLFAEGLRLARLTMAYSSPDGTTPRRHLNRVVAEHRAIEQAITAREADLAERLARDHAHLFRSRIDDFMQYNLALDIAV